MSRTTQPHKGLEWAKEIAEINVASCAARIQSYREEYMAFFYRVRIYMYITCVYKYNLKNVVCLRISGQCDTRE